MAVSSSIQESTKRPFETDGKSAGFTANGETQMDAAQFLITQANAILEQKYKKIFDEKDLITWSNRNQAKIGNEYYFVNKINNLQIRIKDGYTHPLSNIDENNIMHLFLIIVELLTLAYSLQIKLLKSLKRSTDLVKLLKSSMSLYLILRANMKKDFTLMGW